MEERRLKPHCLEGKNCDGAWKGSELEGRLGVSALVWNVQDYTLPMQSLTAYELPKKSMPLGEEVLCNRGKPWWSWTAKGYPLESWTVDLLWYWWSIWVHIPAFTTLFFLVLPFLYFAWNGLLSRKSHAVNASGLKFTVSGRRQFSISCLDVAPHGQLIS